MQQQSRRQFLFVSVTGAASIYVLGCDDPASPTGHGAECDLEAFIEDPCPPQRIARPSGRPWSLGELSAGVPAPFDYPVEGSACFLVKLGAPAEGGVGPDGDVVAFSYQCTHMGCSLDGYYDDDHKALGPCRCHYTTFSLRHGGRVVLGQATQDLVQVRLEVEGDEVFARGLEGFVYGYVERLDCTDPRIAAAATEA